MKKRIAIILLQTFITFIFISTAVNAELKCNTNTKDVWNIFGGDTISYNFSKCEWLTINITPTILGEWRASPNCIEQTAGNFYCTCKDKWNLSLSPKPNSVGIFKLIIKNYYEEPPTKLTVTIISPQNVSYNKNCIPLKFTINKPTSWIGYSLDNKANKTITKNIILTSLSEGMHNVIVYATDNFGQSANSTKVYFTIAKGVIDSIDIGKMNNEIADWLGWSKHQPKTSSGNVWGGVTDSTYWRTVSCSYCKWGDSAYAFVTAGENVKTIGVELLDRAENDSFDVYVLDFFKWVKIGHYSDKYSDSVGHIVKTNFTIPSSVHTYDWIEVKIVLTGQHWNQYNKYGQLAVHKIETFGISGCEDNEREDK
jgi:hypothetical protein